MPPFFLFSRFPPTSTPTSSFLSILKQKQQKQQRQIQDTLDPEYYLGAYKSDGEGKWATTKFADAVPAAAAAAAAAAAGEATGAFAPCCAHAAAAAAAAPAPPPAAAVWERRPLYCVSVPGEAAAAEVGEEKAPAPAAAASAAAKRGRDGDDADGDMADGEEELAAADAAADKKTKKKASKGRSSSKATEGGDGDKPPAPRPLPPRAGDAMVFFYPSSSSSSPASSFSPKLNEVVEVWGVLSRVPELAAAHLDAAAGNGNGNGNGNGGNGNASQWLSEVSGLASLPPTSAVPRLHALFSRKAERHPALASVARERGFVAAAENASSPPHAASSASAARAAALARLRRSLLGDPLAAEYLLLQLVSRVHLRTAGMALGTLALNITHCPKGEEVEEKSPSSSSSSSLSDFASSVAEALAALSPRSVALPLSLQALNATRLRPGRCPLSGRLAQAPLQLAPGTQVLLDETLLAPGQLSALGRDSVDALRGLLADRAVEYDFGKRKRFCYLFSVFFCSPFLSSLLLSLSHTSPSNNTVKKLQRSFSGYCRGSMPADLPVTILSSGKAGSVLRAHVDLAVPLLQQAAAEEETGSGGEGSAAEGSSKELEAAAAALFDTMRTSEFSFGEDEGEDEQDADAYADADAMEAEDGSGAEKKKRGGGGRGAPKWLEEKLLEARRRGSAAAAAAAAAATASAAAGSSSLPPAPTSEADLHLALTLARLYALSHGETVLKKEHWEGVERLEEARRARLVGAAALPVVGGAN